MGCGASTQQGPPAESKEVTVKTSVKCQPALDVSDQDTALSVATRLAAEPTQRAQITTVNSTPAIEVSSSVQESKRNDCDDSDGPEESRLAKPPPKLPTQPDDTAGKKRDGGAWDDWDEPDEVPSTNAPSIMIQPSKFAGILEDGKLSIAGASGEESLNVALTCSHCGHPCVRFPRSRWTPKIDYYHFRNYAPDARMPGRIQEDLVKLCSALEPDNSAAAYACGCSWQTVAGVKSISSNHGERTSALPHGGARLSSDDQELWWKAA